MTRMLLSSWDVTRAGSGLSMGWKAWQAQGQPCWGKGLGIEGAFPAPTASTAVREYWIDWEVVIVKIFSCGEICGT